MGANAASQAVQKARDAGLTVTGTIDSLTDGRIVSSLAERRPSGAVAVLGASAAGTPGKPAMPNSGKLDTRKQAD